MSFGSHICATFLCALWFACMLDLMVSKLFYALILHYFESRTRHIFQRMFLKSFNPCPVMESFQKNDQGIKVFVLQPLWNDFVCNSVAPSPVCGVS